jgi:hypothetical protein
MQIRKSGLAMPSAARYPRVQTRYDGKFWPMALMGGGAEGSHDTRDLLTADNFPIRDLFGQIDDLLRVVSENRQRVSQLFVEEVDNAYVRTYNQVGNILVQRGAEYGRPTAQRVSRASTVQGLPIEPFKMMTMWTREYLALQQAEWLRREAQAFVVADMELQWRIPLQTLFDNLASTTVAFVDPGTNISLTVRAPLYNADGIVPSPSRVRTITTSSRARQRLARVTLRRCGRHSTSTATARTAGSSSTTTRSTTSRRCPTSSA